MQSSDEVCPDITDEGAQKIRNKRGRVDTTSTLMGCPEKKYSADRIQDVSVTAIILGDYKSLRLTMRQIDSNTRRHILMMTCLMTSPPMECPMRSKGRSVA